MKNGETKHVYDLSFPVDRNSLSWPLGVPLFLEQDYSWDKKDSLYASTVKMSLHLGTHLNAPLHYSPGALALHELPLHICMGPCEVIRLEHSSFEIDSDIFDLRQSKVPRLLIDTRQIAAFEGGRYPKLSKKFFLKAKKENIFCIGFDAFFLSWDIETSPDLFLPILEGLLLSKVPSGLYELYALPLSLLHVEASPVRAILMQS